MEHIEQENKSKLHNSSEFFPRFFLYTGLAGSLSSLMFQILNERYENEKRDYNATCPVIISFLYTLLL